MPLTKGASKATFAKNVQEFAHGKTFAKTAEKSGKKAAIKQAVAVAYAQKRKSGGK